MGNPQRICSLLPSATEIVGLLGCADRLVGRSAECDHPPAVTSLPVVSAARLDTSRLPSAAIDQAVHAAVREGRSLYAIDEQLMASLDPDLVITQDLCRVCAVSSAEVREVHAIDVDVLALDPRTLSEIEASVRTIAAALGVADRGDRVAADMRARIDAVRAAVADRPRPPVFVAEWLDPPFAAGHWVPEMVEAAGGRELLGRAGESSFATTWDTVADAAPDLIVVAPCGFTAERGAAEAAGIPAIGGRAVCVHADAYYSRPGPRVADGVAQLGHLLHPDAVADPGLPALQPASLRRA